MELTMTEVAHLSEQEAKQLERLIKQDAPSLKVERVRIGNGEQKVLVARNIYIWSIEDWEVKKNDPDIIAKRMIA